MKKLLILIILFFSMVGCGCSDTDTSFAGDDILDESYTAEDKILDSKEDNYWNNPKFYSCNWDWSFFTTYVIDYSTAPYGYTYAVCTVYIQNNDTESISTNPWDWELIADGISYKHDTMTYSEVINQNTVDVGFKGEFETRFVFLIKDGIQTASLQYTGYDAPIMNHIHYYKSSDENALEQAQNKQTAMDSILNDLVTSGHDITNVGIEDIKINNDDVSATVFFTDDLSEVNNIFEIGLLAYQSLDKTDVYVIDVDGDVYWTPKEDIVKYSYKNTNYESKIYVYFPHGQKVTLENLPSKLD